MTNATIQAGLEFNAGSVPIGIMHPEYLLAFIPIFLFFALYLRRGKMTRDKMAFLAVRSVIILLIVIALGSPVYFQSHKAIEEVRPVTVLVDSSSSMNMYPNATSVGYRVYDKVKAAVGNLSGKSDNVKIEFFSEGNSTAIGDALYHNMVQYGGEPMSLVLVSDGRNNIGRNPLDMAKIIGQTNSTLYPIRPAKRLDDLYIAAVVGDKKVPSNTNYDLLIRVGNTGYKGAAYDLNVYMDGMRKFNQRFTQDEALKDVTLSLTMKDIGIHEIKAEIVPQKPGFSENDVFYKSVEVVDKPTILYVTGNATSPMLEVLKKAYQVEVTGQLDRDYAKYAGVVFDNINAEALDRNQVNKIRTYVMAGNGVGFVGGKNSFEYGGYNNSFIENILPVKSTDKPVERRRDFAILFLVDVSESTEYNAGNSGPDSKIDVEKAVVLNMLQALNANDSVGVIAFNTMPYVVTPISPIGPKYQDVQDTVLKLRFNGGTDLQTTLESADADLRDYTVDKYIILVSDGGIRETRKQMALDKLAQMQSEGIKVFTVGVGFDTDEGFMSDMAQAGGGQYFSLKSDPQTRLKITFGEQADDKSKDVTPVTIRDEYHYITRNLPYLAQGQTGVKGFNKVYEKSVSQLLVSTRGGQPIITVWHFGLGRVAAWTADNGLEWGQDLVAVDSGKAATGMVSWIIGDLEKGKKIRINSQDIQLGAPVSLSITADAQPQVDVKNTAAADTPQAVVTRTSLSGYSAQFMPKNTGFYIVRAQAAPNSDIDEVAVNYPSEYGTLDVDAVSLARWATASGSRLYSEDEADTLADDLLTKVKESATREVRDTKDLWLYFAAAALAVYFIDTAIRRLKVILQRGQERTDEGDDGEMHTKRSSLRRVR